LPALLCELLLSRVSLSVAPGPLLLQPASAHHAHQRGWHHDTLAWPGNAGPPRPRRVAHRRGVCESRRPQRAGPDGGRVETPVSVHRRRVSPSSGKDESGSKNFSTICIVSPGVSRLRGGERMPGALDGVRIIDLTAVLLGPFATQHLAD